MKNAADLIKVVQFGQMLADQLSEKINMVQHRDDLRWEVTDIDTEISTGVPAAEKVDRFKIVLQASSLDACFNISRVGAESLAREIRRAGFEQPFSLWDGKLFYPYTVKKNWVTDLTSRMEFEFVAMRPARGPRWTPEMRLPDPASHRFDTVDEKPQGPNSEG